MYNLPCYILQGRSSVAAADPGPVLSVVARESAVRRGANACATDHGAADQQAGRTVEGTLVTTSPLLHRWEFLFHVLIRNRENSGDGQSSHYWYSCRSRSNIVNFYSSASRSRVFQVGKK